MHLQLDLKFLFAKRAVARESTNVLELLYFFKHYSVDQTFAMLKKFDKKWASQNPVSNCCRSNQWFVVCEFFADWFVDYFGKKYDQSWCENFLAGLPSRALVKSSMITSFCFADETD